MSHSPAAWVGRARRQLSFVRYMFRPRYLLAFSLSHLLPRFSIAPIIAALYRFAGCEIGHGSVILGPLKLLSGTSLENKLHIGQHVVIATDVTINLDDDVTIEDFAAVGPYVRIFTATHPIGPGSRRMMPQAVGKPVVIGRGAWVGMGSMVLPGITIGNGSIVGAGSVVLSDVEPNTYVEGNPARAVRSLPWANR